MVKVFPSPGASFFDLLNSAVWRTRNRLAMYTRLKLPPVVAATVVMVSSGSRPFKQRKSHRDVLRCQAFTRLSPVAEINRSSSAVRSGNALCAYIGVDGNAQALLALRRNARFPAGCLRKPVLSGIVTQMRRWRALTWPGAVVCPQTSCLNHSKSAPLPPAVRRGFAMMGPWHCPQPIETISLCAGVASGGIAVCHAVEGCAALGKLAR